MNYTNNDMQFARNSMRDENMRRSSNGSDMINFRHPVQQTFDSPEMEGSMQQILSENVGNFVVIEFLIGTQQMIRKQGVIYLVGNSFVTLYDDIDNNFIICDIFSVKFVYFYMPGQRPSVNYNRLPTTSGEPGMGNFSGGTPGGRRSR